MALAILSFNDTVEEIVVIIKKFEAHALSPSFGRTGITNLTDNANHFFSMPGDMHTSVEIEDICSLHLL